MYWLRIRRMFYPCNIFEGSVTSPKPYPPNSRPSLSSMLDLHCGFGNTNVRTVIRLLPTHIQKSRNQTANEEEELTSEMDNCRTCRAKNLPIFPSNLQDLMKIPILTFVETVPNLPNRDEHINSYFTPLVKA